MTRLEELREIWDSLPTGEELDKEIDDTHADWQRVGLQRLLDKYQYDASVFDDCIWDVYFDAIMRVGLREALEWLDLQVPDFLRNTVPYGD